jgi:hypothetical protein
MSSKAREVIEPLYKKLLEVEKEGGVDASYSELINFLEENKQTVQSYNEYMQILNEG